MKSNFFKKENDYFIGKIIFKFDVLELFNWFDLNRYHWNFINFDRLTYQSFFNTLFYKYFHKLIKSSTYIDIISNIKYPNIVNRIKKY